MPLKRPAASSHRSLTVQAFWLLFAKILGFAFSFIIPLLLVRALDQRQFGLYKQAFLVIATAQTVLPLGFSLSAFYFLPREPARQAQVVFNISLLNLTMGSIGCLALLLYPRLLVHLVGSAELVAYAPWIGLVVLLGVFASFLEIVATAHQEVKCSTIFIVMAQFTKSVFMASAAIWFPSIRALLYAAALQCLIQTLVLFWYLQSRFPGYWRALDWGLFRVQVSYALPFGLAGLVALVQTDLHNYFVANTFGPAAFAVYAVGCFQLPVIGLLRESVASVSVPRISALQQQGEHREILLLTIRVIRKLAAVYLPVYAFLLVTGREFLVALFTRQYQASWPIFLVNLTLLPLSLMMNDPIVRAYAEYRYFVLVLRLVLAGLLIPGLWLAIAHLGMIGAIAAVVAANLLERLAITWRVAGTLQLRLADLRLLRDVGKLAAISAAAALVAAASRALLLQYKPLIVVLLCGLAFSLAYAAGVFLSGVLLPEERLLLRTQWKRLRLMLAGRHVC